jgi:Rieske Fe-S protein
MRVSSGPKKNYSRMKDQLSRREMIRISTLLTGGICLCHTVLGEDVQKSTCCATPELGKESYFISENNIVIDLAKAEPLKEPGYAVVIINPDKNIQIIIVRTEETEYAALHRLCTHGGQAISYNSERNILQCNNYNHSIFDLDGQVVKGPAINPLKKYETKLESNKLVVLLN